MMVLMTARKIVAIVSSPRGGKSSDLVVNAMIDGAMGLSLNEVKLYHLNQFHYIRDCQAKDECKTTGKCVIKDQVSDVLEEMRIADSVIISTPNYFGQSNAAYRMLEDRMYSFLNDDGSSNLPRGKRLAIIVTCKNDLDGSQDIANRISDIYVKTFGFESAGNVLASEQDMSAPESSNRLLEKARWIGKML